MTTDEEIREKIWNIEQVVEQIKRFPQTYNSILEHLYVDGTCQTILRRKLAGLWKDGTICKTNIPGTRFGKKIFYILPKVYYIMIVCGRLGSEVYCFFRYEKISNFYIKVETYWCLESGLWKKYENKTFFEGKILKWI